MTSASARPTPPPAPGAGPFAGSLSDRQIVARLWPFLRPSARSLVGLLVAMLAATAVALARPVVMGRFVDQVFAQSPQSLWRAGLLLAGLSVALQALGFVQGRLAQGIGARVTVALREHVFVFFQRQRLRFFDRKQVGGLMGHVTGFVDSIGEVFDSGALGVFGDACLCLGIVTIMLVLNWRLAAVAFATLPLLLLVTTSLRRSSRRAYRVLRDHKTRLGGYLFEQIHGMTVTQALQKEAEMAREFDQINDECRDAIRSSIRFEVILDAGVELAAMMSIAAVLYFASRHLSGSHAVTFGLLVTFIQYVRYLHEPASQLSSRYGTFQSALTAAERIFGLLEQVDRPEDPPFAAPASMGANVAGEAAVVFDRVSFSYQPEKPVLQQVSFTIRRGEKVALVGLTGAGKSTVVSLVLRLYDADRGSVEVLGHDVRKWPAAALRDQLSVVLQDVLFFPGTILENVALGDPSPDRARAERALERVGASALVARREQGLDARIGLRGLGYSAGERQLFAFARAVYRDAPIVILDEPTANMDSSTEASLGGAMAEMLRDRTAIIIAHRLSTLRSADRVLVLADGAIAEVGTHDELVRKDGLYARLWRLQALHEQVPRAAEPAVAQVAPRIGEPTSQ